MATEGNEETVTIKAVTRTARVDIETAYNTVPTVRYHRETVSLIDGEAVAKSPWTVVERSLSEVAKDTVTIGDKTLSGAEMAAFIAAFGDRWHGEDIISEAAAAAPAPVVPGT